MDQNCLTLFNQAHQNYVSGDYKKALTLLKKLLEISRNDKEVQAYAYFEIGKIYTDIQKDELAIQFLKKAIPLHPQLLVQEFEWIQSLKSKKKSVIFNEIQKLQSMFKDYLVSETKEINPASQGLSSGNNTGSNIPVRNGANSDSGFIKYAGFWKRVVATLVDGLVILIVNLILLLILVYGFGLSSVFLSSPVSEEDAYFATYTGRFLGYLAWYFVSTLFLWLYYAIMESSKCQGTLGKMLLGIYVADESGRRIGIGKASGRYFLKVLLSVSILNYIVGCIMVAVTPRKQAWHDMPVSCLILSK